jgi:UDP-N-acetylglucosamine 2-epimerase (non-hydrolysing)
MIRVACVFGTRPDAVKMAPVVQELRRFPEAATVRVIVTGQHREMLQQVLDVFRITPDDDLAIMQERQSLAEIAVRALARLDPVLAQFRPDVVLAQGDTSTTFIAALAAFYHHARIGHVEAGLRTANKFDPFPEEINRRLTGVLADFHFVPTPEAGGNLRREGVDPATIHLVGNTVIDALLSVAAESYRFDEPQMEALGRASRLVLVTAHRRENWGEPLARICAAVRRLAVDFPDVSILFQLHKNPIVREVVTRELANTPRVRFCEPQEYRPWIELMKRATLLLTDSGGIQEEAPALGKPVIVMRETTERPEGVATGAAVLAGTQCDAIYAAAARLLTDREAYTRMASAVNPYGDGRAAARIRDVLFRHYGLPSPGAPPLPELPLGRPPAERCEPLSPEAVAPRRHS